MEIGQYEIVTIRPDSVEVIDFTGAPAATRPFEVAWDASAAAKGGWPSFMKKEISEEPEAVEKTILGRAHDGRVTITELDGVADILNDVQRVVVLACGTAAYAGMVGKYAIERWAGIPVDVILERLNSAILEEGERARFLTLVCGVLGPVRGGRARLGVVVAGHPPPFLVRNGEVRQIGWVAEQLLIQIRVVPLGKRHNVDPEQPEFRVPRIIQAELADLGPCRAGGPQPGT